MNSRKGKGIENEEEGSTAAVCLMEFNGEVQKESSNTGSARRCWREMEIGKVMMKDGSTVAALLLCCYCV